MSENKNSKPDQQDAFDRLKPYCPRKFVPADADLTDRDTLVGLYEKLLGRRICSAEELECWLADRSELEAAASQAGAVLYVRMTCHTDDPAKAQAFQDYVENVEPAISPLADKLNRLYLESRMKYRTGPDRCDLYEKQLRKDVSLYRDENVPLKTELSLLSQKYQQICGVMSVEFEGKRQTLPQMTKYLQKTDRDLRQRAWQATAECRFEKVDELEEIFDKMIELRTQVARNAGYDNFMEYRFDELHRFDYTPDDCVKYHEAVEKHVVPLWREILAHRRGQLGTDKLRPWDLSVDAKGREPLAPFETAEELIAGVGNIFKRLDSELGKQFQEMNSLEMLDLDSRNGKAPGGYQSTMSEARKPFIFMNAVGLDRDVRTLLHEGGHAFHALAAADEPVMAYRHAPMEFCEVASMAMELLGDIALDEFYNDKTELSRSITEHLEDVIMILPWVATIDAFQHWLYTNPGHSRSERAEAWQRTLARFDGGVTDWSDYEKFRDYRWHAQLHLFEVPFYYIEYGIAQLGALQVWARALENHSAALADYRKALALGGSKPLPELFEAAGIKFDFSADTIAPLVQKVSETYKQMQ